MVNDAQRLHPQEEIPPQPPTRERLAANNRRRRRRRVVGLIVGIVVVALIATYVGLTLTAPVGAATATDASPTVAPLSAASIDLPSTGESAVSVSGASDYLGTPKGGILASSAKDAPVPMASISKVITALVILKAKPLGASGTGPIIHFTRADTELYEKYFKLNTTIAPMPIGTTMSEYAALETMLVPSACNYAEALGDWAYGSEGAFVVAADAWLKAHGLTHTTMVEPSGVDGENKSTPSDLIALGKLAMANPVIAKIVGKTNVDAVPSLSGFLNTNDLLGVDGVVGIKTGTLDSAGSDLLFSAIETVGTPKPITITGVILGGDSRSDVDTAVKNLITGIDNGFQKVQLGAEGESVGTYTTPWGSSAKIVLAKSASTLVWSDTKIASSLKITPTLTTTSNGETVGTITWVAGKSTVSAPVVLKGTITGPSVLWRLTHPVQLLGK